jgi:hypothetical protein
LDYAGNGTYADPFKFYFAQDNADFNVGTITVNVLSNQTNILARIRKIRLTFDGTTASALNITARCATTVYSYVGNGVGTAHVDAITDAEIFAAVVGTFHDGHVFDFGPDGITFLRGPNTDFNGAWTGQISVQCSGYAATDDCLIEIEGDWWRL